MMEASWNSIAESLVENEKGLTLDLPQALESPCLSCQTSPCCTHLPLNNFKVTTLVELDHALYLLNFDRIELGLSAAGDWGAYYTFPCRHLDRRTFRCQVHNTPEQPQICVHYNPYNCWYKRVFSVGQNEEFVRLDYDRMQFLVKHIEFNEQRQIVSVPAWDDLIALMADFEDQKREATPEPPFEDAALSEWEQSVLELRSGLQPEQNGAAESVQPQSYASLNDPCAGCAAYCCKTLIFPQSVPQHISNLDYYRFCLGFPGIELGIADGVWSIIIKTTCRHLTADNRCSLFGQPERPLICKYYDAWKCDYKPQFGLARPAGFMRVRLEQFAWLSECFAFDPHGAIVDIPPVEAMRQHIEGQWRQAGQLSLPVLPMQATATPPGKDGNKQEPAPKVKSQPPSPAAD